MGWATFTHETHGIRQLVSIAILLSYSTSVCDAQNALDGFNATVSGGVLKTAVVQDDGKLLLGGVFTNVNGVPRTNIARLNIDGTLDQNFNSSAEGPVETLVILPGGQILVSGRFASLAGISCANIGRLYPNGARDLTFTADVNDVVFAMVVQDDGKLVIGGSFSSVNGQSRLGICRLESNGALDSSLESATGFSVRSLAIQQNGKIILGTVPGATGFPGHVARLNVDGTPDARFPATADNVPVCLAVQPDGRILAAGDFTRLNGQSRTFIGRFLPTGELDPDFDPKADSTVRCLAIQPNGCILFGGLFQMVGGIPRAHVARIDNNGLLDPTFNPGTDGIVTTICPTSNQTILLGGNFSEVAGVPRNSLARLYDNGAADATLQLALDPPTGEMAPQPDGRVVLAGAFTTVDGQPRHRLARLTVDGTLDRTFDPGLNTSSELYDYVSAIAMQRDGKIVVAGAFTNLAGHRRSGIARLEASGTLDSSFDPEIEPLYRLPTIFALALQRDGKILIGGEIVRIGSQPRNYLGRLTHEGSLDQSFSAGADNIVQCLAVQADGKILVGGRFTMLAGHERSLVGRLHPDGTIDSSFNPVVGGTDGTFSPPSVYSLAVQPDGKILMAGAFISVGGQSCRFLGRIHSNGILDTAFAPLCNKFPRSFTLQTDGKILVAGSFSSLAGERAYFGRLRADGELDPTFNPAIAGPQRNFIEGVQSTFIANDGKMLVSGNFTSATGLPRLGLARFAAEGFFQSLSINLHGTAVTWIRRGVGTEVDEVSFEQSFDGTNYWLLGWATRSGQHWTLEGLSLPEGRSFYLRSRGRAAIGANSSGLLESLAYFYQLPAPYLASVMLLGDGTLQFMHTNNTAFDFDVLAASNAEAPESAWENLGRPSQLGDGIYQFRDPSAATRARRFYKLRSR